VIASRTIVGLSVGSGLEGVDAAVVHIGGTGLAMVPQVEKSQRFPFSREVSDGLKLKLASPRAVGEALANAVRKLAPGDHFAIGLMTPPGGAFSTAAESVADRTGITTVTAFATRDVAAGGSGSPLTATADYLLHRESHEVLLLHLGEVTSLVALPANGKLNDTLAFDCGPGNRFLDALSLRCSRESVDHGNRAVQGKANDDLIAQWMHEPFLLRKPPKAVNRSDFDDTFIARVLDDAKQAGMTANDLLCTATHFVARCVSQSISHYLPHRERSVLLSGGGTRNGFLRHLLASQMPTISLMEHSLARKAAAAAVLTALMLDGVTASLPHLTGATGGRLLGRIVPGDLRHWSRAAAWVADQLADDYVMNHAA
jgi:anhydro-N-acetylmuramic acid kinase